MRSSFLFFLQRYVGMDQRQPPPMQRGPGFEYRYLTEFQSHEPEFDYLKSLEIEEKINKVRWVRSSNNTKHIIATNDKTIKLWKVRTATAQQRQPQISRSSSSSACPVLC
jgi:hypothetical protein